MRVCNVLDLKIERQLLHDAFRKHLKVDSSVIRQEFQMVNHGNVRKLLGRRVAVANQYILLIWKVRLSAAHNVRCLPSIAVVHEIARSVVQRPKAFGRATSTLCTCKFYPWQVALTQREHYVHRHPVHNDHHRTCSALASWFIR